MEKSIKRRIPQYLFIVIGLLFILGLQPQTALAATHTISDGETFDISTCAERDTVEVDAYANATLTGSKNVLIKCGEGVALTLDSVTSDVSGAGGCALSFSGDDNTLILGGTNTLKSGDFEPGIRVEASTELEIQGNGSLDVTGGSESAGIGGSYLYGDAGTITISSGVVTATGGSLIGAGIGGGLDGDGGTITISGGIVNAVGGPNSAGIGGAQGNGGIITILGGTVNATGGDAGAGIGGGIGDGGTITISGGVVTATGGNTSAGIGGGDEGDGGTITISGGTVTATGGEFNGSGIGGGDKANGGIITISGGTVTATGGEDSAGIGAAGVVNNDSMITISDGTVTAIGGVHGAGIGGGYGEDGGTITISGGTVNSTGGVYSAGIGGGCEGDGGTITIIGGTLFVKRGENGNKDIGPGYFKSGGSLSISGDALVFLANDICLTPNTVTHTHYLISGPLYGFSLPDGWTDAGFYARTCLLTYDDNGGTGLKSTNVPVDGTITVEDSSGLENPGYTFNEWNTMADGSGTAYAPGDSITVSEYIILYAIWTPEEAAMVGSISPADSIAPIEGNVVITFNIDMDTSVTGTVSINETVLSGGVWSNIGRTYTIPYSGLNYYKNCTIDISGFQDSYGTTMTDDSASFTTEAPADLSSLAVNAGSLSPGFDSDTAAYSVDATGIDSIGITAETLDPGASLSINGAEATSGIETSVRLVNGANMIPVVVTAQDGSSNAYIIAALNAVDGIVNDTNLASLSMNSGSLSPDFDPATTTYYASVGSVVDEIELTASASDEKAVMLLNGVILSQGTSQTIALSPGDNEVQLMVVAQDASTQTYTLTINQENNDEISCRYQTHVENIGWQDFVSDGEMSGTEGQSLRLEGIKIELEDQENLDIEYSTHVENIGWQGFVADGEMSGTEGQTLRLEAIKINLTGKDADQYDIYYQVHAQNFGWLDWAKNGEAAGTAGFGYRLEAIRIVVVPKGEAAPSDTQELFFEN